MAGVEIFYNRTAKDYWLRKRPERERQKRSQEISNEGPKEVMMKKKINAAKGEVSFLQEKLRQALIELKHLENPQDFVDSGAE